MNKLLTLLGLLCCFTQQVMADKIQASTTPPTDPGAVPEHLYTMKSGNNYFATARTSPTQTADNYGYFAFYAVDGLDNTYYIYSYRDKKWLGYEKAGSYSNKTGFVTLNDEKVEGAYFKLDNYSGDLYSIAPYNSTGVAGKYLNWFTGIGNNNPVDGDVTLGLWQDNGAADAGSRWTFTEVEQTAYSYRFSLPAGVKVTIGDTQLADGDTYVSDARLSRSLINVPVQEGKFAVTSVNDVDGQVTVRYFDNVTQAAVAAYTRPVVYPGQQDAVGEAKVEHVGDVYTLYNNVLAASFIMDGSGIYFAGSKAMNLEPGTEPFTIAFGNGDNVPASAMTLNSYASTMLEGDPNAVGGAEHNNGRMLAAAYSYVYKGRTLEVIWKAVLRDGSHYLRTELELIAADSIDMFNVIPMIYNVNAAEAGSTPAVVGNTRGAVLMSNKIFAGLENPVGYNTVGDAADSEDLYDLTTTLDAQRIEAAAWTQVASSAVPNRVTEATGAGYPNVYAVEQTDVTLEKGQKVVALLKYVSGNNKLYIGGIDLLDANNDVVASDYHVGYTGTAHTDNSYTFIAPNDGTFKVRVLVENMHEAINAVSTLTTQIYTPKPGVVINTDVVTIQGRWSRNAWLPGGDTWKISSVVGLIAQDGTEAETNIHKSQKRRSFLAYSERERAVPWRPNPAYISWYELNINRNNAADPTGNMSAEQVLDVLNHWKTDFYDRYGVGPQSFVIDDGWDNYGTWTFHAGFPNEMRDICALAEEMGAGAGAWLGPVGGYGTSGNYRRNYWANKGGMVLSNPAYYTTFKTAAHNLTKNQGDFRFFKFDGISAKFSAVGPDDGDTGNENAEGIIRLERYVREELKRDIFFNTTVGTWASPFWYHYTDATWRQENDYGTIGNNSIDRENWITYRDRLVYQNYVTNSPICPINTLMTHGFILSRFGNVSSNMTYEAVRRELRCAFLCGSGMVELYNDYALMNSIEKGRLWADLAECIKWQKRNADVLPDAHWVGGNPWTGSAAQVYGWASWNGTKATLALRNGANDAQTYTFTLREALNIPANVNGSIVLRKSFGEQLPLEGLTEGQAIDIDASLTVTLPGSSVYGFDGLDAAATAVPVASLTIATEQNATEMYVGNSLAAIATVAPAEASFPAIVWSSSNEDVATVSGGFILAKAEGEAVITATATDGSGVSASVTIAVVPKPLEPYALNFDKDADPVSDDRYVKSITFATSSATTQLVIAENERRPYVDKSVDESALISCVKGESVQVTFDRIGGWTNAYVYIDLDHSQQFSFREGELDQTGTELMTYSFYTGSFDNDLAGQNSAGTALSGGTRNTMYCPPFTAPAEAGDYRIRFKMDWNSVDPGGQIAANGDCYGYNGFLFNRGAIIDATLRVLNEPSAIHETMQTTAAKPVYYDLSGRRLDKAPASGVYIRDRKKVVR